MFKPCYSLCEKCNADGDENNHHCTQCKGGDMELIGNNCICNPYYNYAQTGCISIIPDGYYNNDTIARTIDKCPDKCKKCSSESLNSNSCLLCNVDIFYYPKENDPLNAGLFIKCYYKDEEQTGYYLNTLEKIFKLCYTKCNTCNGEGDDDNNNCLECKNNYKLDNGNCLDKYDHIYSYDPNSNTDAEKNDYTHAFIEISEETLNFLRRKFSLGEDDKILAKIFEYSQTDSNQATLGYDYEYYLENGTILNLSDIEEDVYVDVYVPITDLDLAKFNLTKQFAQQGYDIYNIHSAFYTDFCTPANLGKNDISITDRKKDIYPHNLTLCQSNCKYSGINIEEQRVICTCNINPNKEVDKEKLQEEDDGNFLTYLLDNVNYRLFLCYKLFFNLNNLIKSYPFYIILGIFFIVQIFNFVYVFHSLEKLQILMTKEIAVNMQSIKDQIYHEKETRIIKTDKPLANPIKKDDKIIQKRKFSKRTTNYSKAGRNTFVFFINNKNKNSPSSKGDLLKNNENKIISFDNNEKKDETNDKRKKEEDINDLPFAKAIVVDKRNVFQTFYTLIIQKLDLIDIFCNNKRLKIMLIVEYILSLFINFFFNALLYTDDVVSNKYHNNGELDIIVTLTLSILSNIITSIFCYYIKYTRGIEERIDIILDIRYKLHYYKNLKQLILFLKIKFICFIICQIIIFAVCLYYIVIFCIKYVYSQESLILNYCYSLIESLITSFAIAFLILLTRKIGLCCLNKELYNTSKYINTKF